MGSGPDPAVDAYLSAVSSDAARQALGALRGLIRDEVPDAVECISYGMPGYKLNGYLCGFAAFKNHCSFFPGGIVPGFEDQLKDFKTSKGTIQFLPSKPIPEELVRAILRSRVVAFETKK